jgi:hypothetical protein
VPALAVHEETRRQRSRVQLAVGLGGAALIALGGAAGFALSARSTYNRAFEPGQGCQREPYTCLPGAPGLAVIETAGGRADVATALTLGGIALGAAAAAVFYTAPRETVVAPIASRGALGLGIVGRF